MNNQKIPTHIQEQMQGDDKALRHAATCYVIAINGGKSTAIASAHYNWALASELEDRAMRESQFDTSKSDEYAAAKLRTKDARRKYEELTAQAEIDRLAAAFRKCSQDLAASRAKMAMLIASGVASKEIQKADDAYEADHIATNNAYRKYLEAIRADQAAVREFNTSSGQKETSNVVQPVRRAIDYEYNYTARKTLSYLQVARAFLLMGRKDSAFKVLDLLMALPMAVHYVSWREYDNIERFIDGQTVEYTVSYLTTIIDRVKREGKQ